MNETENIETDTSNENVKLTFENKITMNKESMIDESEEINFNEEDEYDFAHQLNKPERFIPLSIKLGSNNHPNFSCACHKCNIATRMAIKKHTELTSILKKLSSYAGKVKNSIELVQPHLNNKAKIHMDNQTRWASSFLLLKSFLNAYKKNAFSIDNPCPVSLEVIEKYLQILLPAYQFNLIMQRNPSTIAEVIPALKIMISKWNRFNVTGSYKKLCSYLVKAFEHKFDYELKSDVYQVSALLNTSMLHTWHDRPDCKEIITNAFDKIDSVLKQFQAKRNVPITNENIFKMIFLYNYIKNSLYLFFQLFT